MTAASLSRGDRSRRAILDAALPIFARDGYAAASLNQIIEASGLTKGAFYFHFASKQALALAVLADHQQGLLERVAAEVNQHPSRPPPAVRHAAGAGPAVSQQRGHGRAGQADRGAGARPGPARRGVRVAAHRRSEIDWAAAQFA